MMIVMKEGATDQQIEHVVERLESVGAKAHVSKGVYKSVIGAIGDRDRIAALPWEAFPGVENVLKILKPFKLVSRQFKEEDSIIDVDGVEVGGKNFCLIIGPCAVESREQLMETALTAKSLGASMLRGGAFKPRSSPYSFQGLGAEGLKILSEAKNKTGLPIVTELMDPRDIDLVNEYADVIQIGARNMQNFQLLTEVGHVRKAVLLKRGFSNTIEELLMAAEYIVKEGNTQVILCERGIRTFETYTRNTLDLSAIPLVKNLSHLPIIVDPSHATGKPELIAPMVLASIAAGADGAMLEIHPNPEEALCDGSQSIQFSPLKELVDRSRDLLSFFGKNISAKKA